MLWILHTYCLRIFITINCKSRKTVQTPLLVFVFLLEWISKSLIQECITMTSFPGGKVESDGTWEMRLQLNRHWPRQKSLIVLKSQSLTLSWVSLRKEVDVLPFFIFLGGGNVWLVIYIKYPANNIHNCKHGVKVFELGASDWLESLFVFMCLTL